MLVKEKALLQFVVMWESAKYGDRELQLMDLDAKSVEQRIMDEMAQGVDVYYDRRWTMTGVFSEWLAKHEEVYSAKKVLVLGAGVGSETVVLGLKTEHLWINDLAPVALELCAEQLEKNGIKSYTPLLGKYEELEMPSVDLVVASFLVYNKETLESVRCYMKTKNTKFLLMNENLKELKQFLKEEEHEVMFETEGAVCVII